MSCATGTSGSYRDTWGTGHHCLGVCAVKADIKGAGQAQRGVPIEHYRADMLDETTVQTIAQRRHGHRSGFTI
jgi:hypothetical protein